MNKKTVIILVCVAVGGCCLFGTATIGAAMLFGEDPPASDNSAPGETVVVEGAAPKLGGYRLAGGATVTAEGFADGLEGGWLMMDGAAVDSIDEITSGHVTVRTSRIGELWHYLFEGDGTYIFRYHLSTQSIKAIYVEKGAWSSDGASLTMNPESCTSKASGFKQDCLEAGERSYALGTLDMEELTLDSRVGEHFPGLRLTGPFPSWCQTQPPYRYRELQRVQ